jgi:sugar phosphate isomerase/epimerase
VKIGAITNGVSEDLDESLEILVGKGLRHAELASVWGVNVGQHTDGQADTIVETVKRYGCTVPCVSPRSFYELPILDTTVDSPGYQDDFATLRRAIDLAEKLGTRLVRAMPFQRPLVIFGSNGAERFLAHQNKLWPKLLKLYEGPVAYAEERDVVLAIETGADTMASSCALGARMARDIGSDHLRIMWDTGNNVYSSERQFPEGYEAVREYLVHIQVKDVRVDLVNASVEFCPLGEGDLADQLAPMADALRADGYDGVVSLENVYRPPGLTQAESFAKSVDTFVELFG